MPDAAMPEATTTERTSTASEPLIVARGLDKRFGAIHAVRGINLTVRAGEVLGFLGPNGAGKSTTMRMLTGFLEPTAGSVTLAGISLQGNPLDAKRTFGYLPEGAPGYPDMRVEEFLRFIGRARGFNGDGLTRAVDTVMDRVNLGTVRRQTLETLSKGFKRRVGLAQALIHDPRILILDEPTDGLDPNQKHEVRELIRHLGTDRAVVLSTHILEEVEAVCTRALIINRGEIVFDGTPDDMDSKAPRSVSKNRLDHVFRSLTTKDTAEDATRRVARSLGVEVKGASR
ncbi:MAG: ABC transporter ATP-binding protein [Planctomycetota bacterium]|nr:ABC transporter ATP-binding protein [Planctomycetota bacterium]MDA1106123.1 ABC transporter ATP-binding protein [Planctomycetota bacterium]